MAKNDTEAGAKASCKSLRSLLEALEIAVKFYGVDEILSAANDLLSHSRYDTFEAYSETDLIGFSSNPEVVYQKLLEWKKEGISASLVVICGHCGQEDTSRHLSSTGGLGAQHIKFLINNFPPEV